MGVVIMKYKYLLTKVRNHILILTLDRHEAKNTLNNQLRSEIQDAMEKFEKSDNLWVKLQWK